MRRTTFVCLFLLFSLSTLAQAQTTFFSSWENRVRSTSAKQPGWAVPVFTPSSGLVQLVRTDVLRQITPTHTSTWNYDGSKGFNLIPWYKTELDINMPPYVEHNNPKVNDGAGDISLLLKYRILGANEKQGAYAVSAGISSTAPTGSYSNGSPDGTISPNIYLGKGYGSFDLQTSASISLPTGHTKTMGRPIVWNTVLQYKANKIFWPEVETNATYYRGGTNNGRVQAFVSPGVMVGKIKFSSDPKNRMGIVFGVGEQIAFSSYHAYNHSASMTTRLVF